MSQRGSKEGGYVVRGNQLVTILVVVILVVVLIILLQRIL